MRDQALAARVLVRAEARLRAAGLTGAQAFDALDDALAHRAGRGDGDGVHPVAAEAVAELPRGPVDVLGLAYERFFADLFKGRRGQYFTPPPLVELLASRVTRRPGQRVLDPAAGSAGLLRAMGRRDAELEGIELDPRLARLARRVLALAGLDATVRQGDMFVEEIEPADVVVANPPFSVRVDAPEVLNRWGLQAAASSDQLFARALARWVVPGGQAAVVMPTSLLSNPRWASEREVLDDAFARQAVCSLPEGVFRPFGGAAGRAVLLWLRRRHPAELPMVAPMAWAELVDPGYDPRSLSLKPTDGAEVEGLVEGQGWSMLPGDVWVPPATRAEGRGLGELATVRRERHPGGGPVQRLDLADVDRRTGEARPVAVDELPRGRQCIRPGDVCVARLRPELGNVVVAPTEAVGSPEWVVLAAPRYGHYLWLALRTRAWRAQLPVTGGQTRPRVRADDVVDTAVPWPGDELVEAVDAVAAQLLARRRELEEALGGLQRAVADFGEHGDASTLHDAVSAARSALALPNQADRAG